MKYAIISDTHLGVRNGSDIFIGELEKFYKDIFFPYLLKHGIKKIIHMGDYYDHRKYVNFKVLSRDREMFLKPLEDHGITMEIIPGNHDVYHKNTNELTSLKLLLENFSKNVNVYMEPTVVETDGCPIALVPWISPDNETGCLDFISQNKAPILIGHFDFSGFEMMKGGSISHGYDVSLVEKYEMVLSGHFHTKSSKGNIHYLGTQYESSWSDCGDPKFFHVLDTCTRELTPVRNPSTLFNRVVYNDSDSTKRRGWLESFSFDHLKNTFVKIIVAEKGNPILFDKFIEKISQSSPFEIKVVESFAEFTGENVETTTVKVEDTATLLNTYIEAVETQLDKNKIKKRLLELLTEAQSLEVV